MDDTLSVKALDTSTLDSANKPGSAMLFPRVENSVKTGYSRRWLDTSGLSPNVIRISHTPRVNGKGVQKSVVSFERSLARLDADSNPVGQTYVIIRMQSDIPADVTLDEFKAQAKVAFGAILDSTDAFLTAIYNGEV